MTQRKLKVLNYRRARLGYSDSDRRTLEELLRSAYAELPYTGDRKFFIHDKTIQGINHSSGDSGIFMHIVVYTPGQEAPIVPQAETVSQEEIETVESPQNAEFMNGDIMVLVKGDHCFFCVNHSHESYIQKYFIELFREAECGERGRFVRLEKVGDFNKAEVLRRDGIKKIVLNASLYDATFRNIDRNYQNTSTRIVNEMSRYFLSPWVDDGDPFNEDDSITAELAITSKGRIENESQRQEKLFNMSQRLLDEEDDDNYVIITKKDEKIKSSEIVVKDKARLDPFGSSVFYRSAWSALEDFYLSLYHYNLLQV